jgi:hypothetical protein
MAATETTITSRAFGRCPVRGCRYRRVLEVQGAPSLYTAFSQLRTYPYCCPDHKAHTLSVDIVRGTVSPQTPCRQACTDAMTPNCRCSCGGAHHGENVAEHDRWSGS